MSSSIFPENQYPLFVGREGTGVPMIVLHGGLGWDHTYLQPWLSTLGDRLELIFVDLRGNGRSPAPAEWDEVSHATWVDDVEGLRSRLGFERVLLFGHSYGGHFALEYALRYPERLLGMILCTTAGVFDYPEAVVANAQARGTPTQVQTLGEALSGPLPSDEAFRDTMETLLPLFFYDPRSELAGTIFNEVIYRAGAFNHAFFRCLPEYNVLHRLPEIRVPALVLGGHGDLYPLAPTAKRLHAGLANSELVIFEQSGHFPFAEEPEAFEGAVRNWLDRVGSTAADSHP
jgi:proline iminopeptidase